MFIQDSQLKEKKYLKPGEIALFFICGHLLIHSSTIILQYMPEEMGLKQELFIKFNFYGDLLYFLFLVVSLVVKIKSRIGRQLLLIPDLIWYVFHFVLYLQLQYLKSQNLLYREYNKAIDHFVLVYEGVCHFFMFIMATMILGYGVGKFKVKYDVQGGFD